MDKIYSSALRNLASLREPKNKVAQRRERSQRKKYDIISWLLLSYPIPENFDVLKAGAN